MSGFMFKRSEITEKMSGIHCEKKEIKLNIYFVKMLYDKFIEKM